MRNTMLPQQPLLGANIKTYFKLLLDNEFAIGVRHLPKALYTALVSALASSPLAILEKWNKQKEIEQTPVPIKPIFIIGHWRSGTTFLHYLMAKDSNLAYLNNAQSFCPNYTFYHFDFLKKIINLHLPNKRPMDNMEIAFEYPQEEEFALGNMSGQSCYLWWTFPNKMVEYFEKYALLKNLKEKEYQNLKNTYAHLMQKLSLLNQGKSLLLKNPVNTGRIPMLLELFPDAQFIYLYRNPVDVYQSTVKLHTKLMECFALQDFDAKKIEEHTFTFYQQLLQKYQEDKKRIPIQNLIEVDYQQLTKEPIKVVAQIYQKLNIPYFEQARFAFQEFIESQKNYQAEIYTINEQKKEELAKLTNVLWR